MQPKVLIFFLLFTLTLYSHDYYTIDEFASLHPEQKEKMEQFDNIVKSPPVKLTKIQKNL